MIDVIKVVVPSVLSFLIGISITPFFTNIFYKYKMWKKSARTEAGDITNNDFGKIHNTSEEVSTPRIGGVIIWVSVLFTMLVVYLLSVFFQSDLTEKLNFWSRSQTYVPIGALILASLIGLADDLLQIFGKGFYAKDPLIYRKVKIVCITLIGLGISYWFYDKLEFTSIHIPFGGELQLGLWFIPFFIVVMLGVFSSSVIDGMDGLSGGVMSVIFTAYSLIAFANNQIDISVLCAVIAGATLAFLWFNIPPARFWMTETGTMSLTLALSVVVFMTDDLGNGHGIALLPIIGLPLVATVVSNVLQMSYRKATGRKLFRIAPLHHHFEAIGWPSTKVTMRYWIISIMCGVIGLALAMIS